jgi:hypothetical protein
MVQREFDRAWAQADTKLSVEALFNLQEGNSPSSNRDVPSSIR